jgi:hypothetical protein
MKDIRECPCDIGRDESTIITTLDLKYDFLSNAPPLRCCLKTAFMLPGLGQY